ncbi:MAG: roadblock/LC7 domain-containing protein [Rhodocyclales bacterium]|nr:roadblock/LC7 domain-containing protein [Rhodocyclales bacterium]
MSLDLIQEFARLLQELHEHCQDIRGTVVATQDGFILSASGELDNDTAAATAVHLTEVAEQHLSLLRSARCIDQIVWTDNSIWYITRLADEYILMAVAESTCTPGMLRLVSRNIDDAVRTLLGHARAEVESLNQATTEA